MSLGFAEERLRLSLGLTGEKANVFLGWQKREPSVSLVKRVVGLTEARPSMLHLGRIHACSGLKRFVTFVVIFGGGPNKVKCRWSQLDTV